MEEIIGISRMKGSAKRLGNLAFEGFGVGIGLFAAFALYIFVGLIFFVPGYLMYLQEKKKGENKNTASEIFSIILMGIGVIIMGGVGLPVLLQSLGDFS